MITIIRIEQGNPYYNPDTANNGGGYDQPRVFFELDGVKGVFEDLSCGDFGRRWFLDVGEFHAMRDEMDGRGFSCFGTISPEQSEELERSLGIRLA